MKKNEERIMMKIKFAFLLPALYAVVLTSCLKDNTDEQIAAHDQAFRQLKEEYGFTEEENIGDNIYVQITDTSDVQGGRLVENNNNFIVMDYVGKNSDGVVFDVTRETDARGADLHRNDLIYGPLRLPAGNTFSGFAKAIRYVPEGAEAEMLFPYDQAFLDYEPVVYEVTLYQVITDIEKYDSLQMLTYMDALGYPFDTMNFEDSPSVYYKTITAGDDSADSVETGDSVIISINAYYVEVDSSYVDSIPGRQFFPINQSGDLVKFIANDNQFPFPITEIINISVGDMKIGETRLIISPSDYAYGNDGFMHPYISKFIVPPHMPVHYKIKLVDIIKPAIK